MVRDHQLNADTTTGAVPPARIACLEKPFRSGCRGAAVWDHRQNVVSRAAQAVSSDRAGSAALRPYVQTWPFHARPEHRGRRRLRYPNSGTRHRSGRGAVPLPFRGGCTWRPTGKEASITAAQAYSLVNGTGTDSCWTAEDRATLSFVDELHDTGHVSDPTWAEMSARFSDETLIELLVLAGWYHTISFLASGTRTESGDLGA